MTATFSAVVVDPSPTTTVDPSVAGEEPCGLSHASGPSLAASSVTLFGLGAGPAAHAASNPDRRHPARQRSTICPQCGRRAGAGHYRDTGNVSPCPDWACPTLHALRNR